jgi:hypothetical protein
VEACRAAPGAECPLRGTPVPARLDTGSHTEIPVAPNGTELRLKVGPA